MQIQGRWYLAGIVSAGYSCARERQPGWCWELMEEGGVGSLTISLLTRTLVSVSYFCA